MDIAAFLLAIGSFGAGAEALKRAFANDRPNRQRVEGLDRESIPYEERPMTVKTHKVSTIGQRLGYIIQMVQKGRDNPEVRRRTVQILSQKCGKKWCTPEKNWAAEVKTVFNAVRSQIRYVRDTHNKDLFQHPLRTFEFGGGDCDDYSIVVASMLQSVGYPVKLRVIRTVDSPDWNHIYNLVGLPPQNPTRWMALDASVDKPAGWQAPKSMVAQVKDFEIP